MLSKLATAFNRVLSKDLQKSASLFSDDPLYNYNHDNVFFDNPIANDATWGAAINAPLGALAVPGILSSIDQIDSRFARPQQIAHLTDEELLKQYLSWEEEKRRAFASRTRIRRPEELMSYLNSRRPRTGKLGKTIASAIPVLGSALIGASLSVPLGLAGRAIQEGMYDDSFLARLTDSILY